MKLSEEQREDVMIKPLPKPDLVKIAKNWVNENHGGTVTQQVFHDLFEEIGKLRSSNQAWQDQNVELRNSISALQSVVALRGGEIQAQIKELSDQEDRLNQAVEVLKWYESKKPYLSNFIDDDNGGFYAKKEILVDLGKRARDFLATLEQTMKLSEEQRKEIQTRLNEAQARRGYLTAEELELQKVLSSEQAHKEEAINLKNQIDQLGKESFLRLSTVLRDYGQAIAKLTDLQITHKAHWQLQEVIGDFLSSLSEDKP
jgi:chromosome segregation ATPase